MKRSLTAFVLMIMCMSIFSLMAVSAVTADTPVTGLPYDNFVFGEVAANPFGTASYFNVFVTGDCVNPGEIAGALAVSGKLMSSKDVSVGRGVVMSDNYKNTCLAVYGDVSIAGYLDTYGNVLAGSENFSAKPNSVYTITSVDDTEFAILDDLYSTDKVPWEPIRHDNRTDIISQSGAKYISAGQAGSKLFSFFEDAEQFLFTSHGELVSLNATGEVTQNDTSFILKGDSDINVFNITADVISDISFDTPVASVNIVNITDVRNVTGVWGDAAGAHRVIYNISSQKFALTDARIYGSILSPGGEVVLNGECEISGNLVVQDFTAYLYSNTKILYTPFAGN